ncbi:YifB family Mg chelatase-like AAA ATPase [bacterium]|nr:YifB family Mg chelatase-like AAA ATPase [bacterium]
MLARIRAVSLIGLEAFPVEVECDLRPMLTKIVIVGLPDASLKEAQERVESAIKNSDLEWPNAKIVVNLAPADLRKEGPAFDLPIALAILCANGQCDPAELAGYLIAGELSLDGSLRPVPGVLPMALKARELGLRGIVIPAQNASEAAVIEGLEVIPIEHLAQCVSWARGYTEIQPAPIRAIGELLSNARMEKDFADVKGQEHAKRALEVAAAGGHNLLMVGPPGSGKTMLAGRLPGILPDLSEDEALEVTRIYSVAGLLDPSVGLVTSRPYRAPHHTASIPGVIGGGTVPRPGEISLAHQGVLFIDEMPEMSRTLLETLRQPLEDGQVTISRAHLSLTFPSRFMLIGAMNPCPCGYYSDVAHKCTCSMGAILNYRQRLSGPLLDRIDMTLEVSRLSVEKLVADEPRRLSRSRQEQAALGSAALFAAGSAAVAGAVAERPAEAGSAAEGRFDDSLPQYPKEAAAASAPAALQVNGIETSHAIKLRVMAAREMQRRRIAASEWAPRQDSTSAAGSAASLGSGGSLHLQYRQQASLHLTNAALSSRQVRAFCALDEAGQALLTRAVERLGLSARAYERIRKVSRTIADLAGSEHIEIPHLAEAIQYYRAIDLRG